jgi:hypothetical protein
VANCDWNSRRFFGNAGRATRDTTACGLLKQPDKQKTPSHSLDSAKGGIYQMDEYTTERFTLASTAPPPTPVTWGTSQKGLGTIWVQILLKKSVPIANY